MRKIALTVMLFAASGALGQTPAKEPDTLQSLLLEVRQLRQDIEAMTVASQRVQIALYALQMQDAAVARSTQRADTARDRCSGALEKQRHNAAEFQRMEDALASGKLTEAETKEVQNALTREKNMIEADTAEVQTCQANEAEASGQLRNEQAKMTGLQDKIERLDKALEKYQK